MILIVHYFRFLITKANIVSKDLFFKLRLLSASSDILTITEPSFSSLFPFRSTLSMSLSRLVLRVLDNDWHPVADTDESELFKPVVAQNTQILFI